ncbi:putative Ig domain-containing protein [Sneathiella sp.]|uniref:putative Ig domain-containing protein n=1 Tax=Sneathiella sp. TaxID=1964365 RepID=UPI002FE37F60
MGFLSPQNISNSWRGQSIQLQLSVDDYNVNLFELAQEQPNFIPGLPAFVTVIVESGVIIGSESTALKALRTGVFAAGSLIHLTVDGRIQGMGGAGGKGSNSEQNGGSAGLPGGDALHIETPTILDYAAGQIWGGGGGGGGGRHYRVYMGAGGGGGGAGSLPGAGGAHGGDINGGNNGSPGTSIAGGEGGALHTAGGKGGDPGEPGDPGSTYATGQPAYAGGAAGAAITATAALSIIGYGDLRGPAAFAAYPVSAVIGDGSPDTLTVIFSKSITSGWFITGVSITIDDVPVTGLAASPADGSSDTLVFTFNEEVEAGQEVRWSYNSGPGDWLDADGFNVPSISGALVTNNVAPPEVAPPVITVHPGSQSVVEGDDVNFVVVATGATGYQWRLDGTPISGETSSTLTLEDVALALDGAEIDCVVSNSDGSVISDAAILTVNEFVPVLPVITVQPSNQTVTEGANATFSVTATGATGYQWRLDEAPIPGATSSTLILEAVTLGDDGAEIDCVVSNEDGSVTSNAATLTVSAVVLNPPVITVQPINQSVTEGENATFTVTATGADSYQWYMDEVALVGETSASLTLTAVELVESGSEIYVVVANSDGAVASNTVILTVTAIVDPPADAPRYLGGDILPIPVIKGSAMTAYDFGPRFDDATSYAWEPFDAVQDQLLDGLTLNTSTGILSGTPTYAKPIYGRVKATNAEGTAISGPIMIYSVAHNNFSYGSDVTYDGGETGTFYVDASVVSSGDGTSWGTAFKTITEARNAAHAAGGVQKIIVAGETPGGDEIIYRESVSLGAGAWSALDIVPRGTSRPTISAFEILTGWTPCTAGDAARVGPDYAKCYKVALPSGFTHTNIPPEGLNLHEAGVQLRWASDKAVEGDPAALKVFTEYHSADSFGTVGGKISSITDADVLSAYTAGQLTNARVYYHRNGNYLHAGEIASFDGTDTITLATADQDPQSGSTRFALFNVPLTAPGQWMFESEAEGDGSRYLYIWPYDARNLTDKIEVSARTFCVDWGAVQNTTIEGFNIFGASGSLTREGVCAGTVTSATSGGVRTGNGLKNCVLGKNWHSSRGYGAIYFALNDDLILEQNTILQTTASFGVFTQRCNDWLNTNALYFRCGQAIHRSFGNNYTDPSEHQVLYRAYAFFNGFDEHANAVNFYEGQIDAIGYALQIYRQYGYVTWQEASGVYIGESYIEPSRLDYVTGGTDGRAIVDQGGTLPSGGDDEVRVWNVTIPPRPDGTGGFMIIGYDASVDTRFYNMILNGGGATGGAAALAEEKNNLYTGLLSGQSSGSLDPTDTHDNDLAETYVDPSSGNFNYVEDGNAGKSGADISAMLSTLAVKFPEIDFTRDMHGDLITSDYVGGGYPGFGGTPVTAPEYTGSVSNLTLTENTAMTPVDFSEEFGGGTPTSYSISSIPSGLSFNTSSGVLSGTPDDPDDDKTGVTVTATNSAGSDTTDPFNITVDAAAPPVSINDVHFDSSTWYAFTPPAASKNLTVALKIRRTSTAETTLMSSEGANNSRLRFASGASSSLYTIMEETSGSPHTYTSAGGYAKNAELAIVVSVTDGTQKVMINGALAASGTDSYAANLKMLSLINSLTAAGSGQSEFDIIGPLFLASAYIDAEANWGSFFDANNDPIFGSTVESVAADVFIDEDAAGWNALPGTTGTVTDN